MSVPVPYPEIFWWLIPGKLGGMSRPSKEDLSLLSKSQIKGIVSVMDEPSGIEEYKENGFLALWLPITGGKPPTVKQVKEFTEFAKPVMENNRSIVVHCTSGNRRTGTLLASYLISQGELPEKAIELIQQVRPTAELRDIQKEFLFNLPQLLG